VFNVLKLSKSSLFNGLKLLFAVDEKTNKKEKKVTVKKCWLTLIKLISRFNIFQKTNTHKKRESRTRNKNQISTVELSSFRLNSQL
jgi:hypothetical protein